MIFTPTKSSPRHSHPHHPTSPALPPPHESVSLHFSLPLTLALTPPVPQHPHTFFPSESLSLSMLNQSLSLLYKCHQTSERGRQQLFNELLCPSIKQLLKTLNLFAVICSPLLRENKEKSQASEKQPLASGYPLPFTFNILSQTLGKTPSLKHQAKPT